MFIYRPGRALIAATVIGYVGIDLTAVSFETGRIDQFLWGMGGMLLATILTVASLRWLVRYARGFFH